MKIISILRRLSTAAEADKRRPGAQWAEWLRDPLAHPDLDAMSERELADLPFARGAGAMAACGDRCP
jgi:hypothetical protein